MYQCQLNGPKSVKVHSHRSTKKRFRLEISCCTNFPAKFGSARSEGLFTIYSYGFEVVSHSFSPDVNAPYG